MIFMQNWESTLVRSDTTLAEAVKIIDKSGWRIALVVDENNRLLGTLTDGDVRRALLNNVSLSSNVDSVMCSAPQTAPAGLTSEKLLSIMERRELLQLPIVDDEGRVIDLKGLHALIGPKPLNNPVFLMAGGFGTRLYPLTENCPKPLLKVGGKPILEIIIDSFIKCGFHRFFISTHYLPEMIREYFGDGSKWGVTIKYVHEENPLGTGGALGLLPHEEIDDFMIMMNGDLLTKLDYRGLIDFHKEHLGAATMCVREYDYQVPYGVIKSNGHLIESMMEKPVYNFYINAGIYLLSPDLVKSVSKEECVDMPTLLSQQIEKGNLVNMYPIHEYWLDIGRMEDFQRAQDHVARLYESVK